MEELQKLISGKKVLSVSGEVDSDTMQIEFDDGSHIRMYHEQDCCESVSINDINGDLNDLIGQEILLIEERTNEDDHSLFSNRNYEPESFTWTFYTIRTIKDTIVIRWLGESNGYYSESVNWKYYDSLGKAIAGSKYWDLF